SILRSVRTHASKDTRRTSCGKGWRYALYSCPRPNNRCYRSPLPDNRKEQAQSPSESVLPSSDRRRDASDQNCSSKGNRGRETSLALALEALSSVPNPM